MSNPTTVAENFSGSLGAFSGLGAIRYDDGLWLEEGTTNLLLNPSAESDATTGTSVRLGATITRDTTYFADGAASFKVVTPNAAAGEGANFRTSPALGLTGSSLPFSEQIQLRKDPATPSATVNVLAQIAYSDATFTTGTPILATLTDVFQTVSPPLVTANPAKTANSVTIIVSTNTKQGVTFYADAGQIEEKDHATSYTASTRAASSASVTISEPAAVACWYREGYSGPKTFAYLEPYGTLGTYGSIAWSGGTLTLSTSRNLVIGPFAAFSRALTANEQANLRSTQNWSMNSVNGSNIILPLSGRRRPR